MTSHGLRFAIEPRMVPPAKAARRIGLTLAEFQARAAELEAAGFPVADPLTGCIALESIDIWIDRRAGLKRGDGAVSEPSAIMDRIGRQAWAK